MLYGGAGSNAAWYALGVCDGEHGLEVDRLNRKLLGIGNDRQQAQHVADQIRALAAENARLRRSLADADQQLTVWQENYRKLEEWSKWAEQALKDRGVKLG